MAETLATLITKVKTITGRQSLDAMTSLAVQAATLSVHQADDWIKDLGEYSINFPTAEYFQTLDYKSIIPRWRKPRYVRIYDYTTPPGTPAAFLEYLVPEKVIDSYGYNREDVFYVAGANVQIRTRAQQQYFLLGVYENPDITEASYSSWIADEHPFAIIYQAVVNVMNATGLQEDAGIYLRLAAAELIKVQTDAVTGIGS